MKSCQDSKLSAAPTAPRPILVKKVCTSETESVGGVTLAVCGGTKSRHADLVVEKAATADDDRTVLLVTCCNKLRLSIVVMMKMMRLYWNFLWLVEDGGGAHWLVKSRIEITQIFQK